MNAQRVSQFLILATFVIFSALSTPAAATEPINRFFGSYVGSGTAERINENAKEQRDLDVQIGPYKDNGFLLKWITVVRTPDGERAATGVKRREVSENFVPYEGKKNVFIDAPSGGLFSKAELPNPLKGEPLRWAALNGDTLTVYSMAIAEDGRSELQVYHRTLTQKGLQVSFLRMRDEKVLVRLTGELVKAQ